MLTTYWFKTRCDAALRLRRCKYFNATLRSVMYIGTDYLGFVFTFAITTVKHFTF